MGQAKRDRAAADKKRKIRLLHEGLIADRITEIGCGQLVAAGVIVEMDPAEAERLKVLL